MKIIKINPQKPHQDIIDETVETLRHGGVIIYPTDTCYGIGADMTNIFALEKIYRIKGREYRKPLSMIIKDIEQLEKYALVESENKSILSNYLPGPFTFILLNINYQILRQSSIGIRMPDYKITQLIANGLHRPFATTSANKSGFNPCYSVSCILNQIEGEKYLPNLILDAGDLPKNPPSTVVDLTDNKPRVLRQGGVKFRSK
ncbi:MAG: hypothetical protein ACD_58C00330G0002 [uncultured bacterium]|nr:MAG: hypothetical protein ACD_58C00330G0002 [uncultured bacterium]